MDQLIIIVFLLINCNLDYNRDLNDLDGLGIDTLKGIVVELKRDKLLLLEKNRILESDNIESIIIIYINRRFIYRSIKL